MHRLRLLAFVAATACVASACNHSASTYSGSGATSSSSSSSAGKSEVMLSGETGIAELAGDKIEVKQGTVFRQWHFVRSGSCWGTSEVRDEYRRSRSVCGR
jgi:hypothetical protein